MTSSFVGCGPKQTPQNHPGAQAFPPPRGAPLCRVPGSAHPQGTCCGFCCRVTCGPVAAQFASLVCSGPPAMIGYSSSCGGRCACAIIPQWHPGVTPCLPLRDAVRLSFKAAAPHAAPASRVGRFWVSGIVTKPAGFYHRRPRGSVWRQPPPVATVPSQLCAGARVPRVCVRVLCRNVCVPVRSLRAPCRQLTRAPTAPRPPPLPTFLLRFCYSV